MQKMLMNRAIRKGAIIVFAAIMPARMIVNAASFMMGEDSIDSKPLIFIPKPNYRV